jgi:hypothetical protein
LVALCFADQISDRPAVLYQTPFDTFSVKQHVTGSLNITVYIAFYDVTILAVTIPGVSLSSDPENQRFIFRNGNTGQLTAGRGSWQWFPNLTDASKTACYFRSDATYAAEVQGHKMMTKHGEFPKLQVTPEGETFKNVSPYGGNVKDAGDCLDNNGGNGLMGQYWLIHDKTGKALTLYTSESYVHYKGSSPTHGLINLHIDYTSGGQSSGAVTFPTGAWDLPAECADAEARAAAGMSFCDVIEFSKRSGDLNPTHGKVATKYSHILREANLKADRMF